MASGAVVGTFLAGNRPLQQIRAGARGGVAWRASPHPPGPFRPQYRRFNGRLHTLFTPRASDEKSEEQETGEAELPSASPVAKPKRSFRPYLEQYEQKSTWFRITMLAIRKLKENLVSILVVHTASDGLLFLLHRLCHRLTNEIAVRAFPVDGLVAAIHHNPWYLVNDPSITSGTGYQKLSLTIFALSFALNVLIKAWAALCTLALCQADPVPVEHQPKGLVKQLLATAGRIPEVARPLLGCWRAVWAVELLVAALVIPLQFASTLLVTLPITLPIMLELQTASPAAAFEGRGALGAVLRSRSLVRRVRLPLAVPFIGSVVLQRLSVRGRDHVLGMLPARLFVDVVEIPVLIFFGGALISLLLLRFQDVLPYAAYTESIRKEREEAQAIINGGEGSS